MLHTVDEQRELPLCQLAIFPHCKILSIFPHCKIQLSIFPPYQIQLWIFLEHNSLSTARELRPLLIFSRHSMSQQENVSVHLAGIIWDKKPCRTQVLAHSEKRKNVVSAS